MSQSSSVEGWLSIAEARRRFDVEDAALINLIANEAITMRHTTRLEISEAELAQHFAMRSEGLAENLSKNILGNSIFALLGTATGHVLSSKDNRETMRWTTTGGTPVAYMATGISPNWPVHLNLKDTGLRFFDTLTASSSTTHWKKISDALPVVGTAVSATVAHWRNGAQPSALEAQLVVANYYFGLRRWLSAAQLEVRLAQIFPFAPRASGEELMWRNEELPPAQQLLADVWDDFHSAPHLWLYLSGEIEPALTNRDFSRYTSDRDNALRYLASLR